VCNDRGKFLMSDRELNSISRMMAGTLRHFPERFELAMDDHGWVSLFDMVDAFRDTRDDLHWLRPRHVQAIVESDEKGRYEIDDEMIRATYAHSVDIDLDLPTNNIPDKLYYPASSDESEGLLSGGIRPGDRKYVHLSKTYKNAFEAGSGRNDAPVIIEIDVRAAEADGLKVMHAASTVYLTEEVPSKYVRMAPEEDISDDEKAAMRSRTRPEPRERRDREPRDDRRERSEGGERGEGELRSDGRERGEGELRSDGGGAGAAPDEAPAKPKGKAKKGKKKKSEEE
jgi:putative RNA 2'-phosphotransferase